MRIGLVGCVKQKASTPRPAGELYVSALFHGRRRYVERSCERWFILSARHGLVEPSTVLEPYDETLSDVSSRVRGRWSQRVLDQLADQVGSLGGHVFEIHAGSAYRDFGLVTGLQAAGAVVDVPTEGLPIGKLLAFYAGSGRREGERPTRIAPAAPASVPGRFPLREFLERSSPPVTLSFGEIERILGRPLPPSARTHRAWWANSASQVLGRQWLAAGWRAEMVNLTDERIRLTR